MIYPDSTTPITPSEIETLKWIYRDDLVYLTPQDRINIRALFEKLCGIEAPKVKAEDMPKQFEYFTPDLPKPKAKVVKPKPENKPKPQTEKERILVYIKNGVFDVETLMKATGIKKTNITTIISIYRKEYNIPYPPKKRGEKEVLIESFIDQGITDYKELAKLAQATDVYAAYVLRNYQKEINQTKQIEDGKADVLEVPQD